MIQVHRIIKDPDSIRLSESQLRYEGKMVEINILAKNSDGFLIYPEPFYIKKINIAKYPTDKNSTNKAYLIPLCDLIATPTKKYVPYNVVCPKCKKDMQQILKGNTVSYRCNCGGKVGIEWILEEEREKQSVLELEEKEALCPTVPNAERS